MIGSPFFTAAIIIFLILDFVLVFYVFLKKRKTKTFRAEELQYIQSHWIRIIDSLNSYPSQAVLDADKLLDYALSRKGFVGSMGEKLKKSKSRFSDLDSVWRAHKLRNKLAHELFNLDLKDAKSAIVNFKRALNDLGANL